MNTDILPKHIVNVTNESADINLFDAIGGDAISGQRVADEIKMLADFGIKTINIHINSPGGSILDGFSIFSAIKNSEATVNTHIDGVAASIAGIIAMAGEKIFMADFGRLMIHNPMIGGDDNPDDPKAKAALQSLKDSLITIFKGRTKKSKSELSEMMNKETWLSPQEALDQGFIDEIVKVTSTNRMALEEITNVLKPENSNTKKMEQVCAYLELTKDATEEAILVAIKKIAADRDQNKTDLEAKETELNEANETIEKQKKTIKGFEENQTELNKKIVEEAIDNAIKEGKIEKEKKDEIVEKFENNLEGLELMLGSLKAGAVKITNELNNSEETSADIPEGRKDWNLRKWEKEDPEGLENIRKNNPDLYKEMYKNQYKVEYAG